MWTGGLISIQYTYWAEPQSCLSYSNHISVMLLPASRLMCDALNQFEAGEYLVSHFRTVLRTLTDICSGRLQPIAKAAWRSTCHQWPAKSASASVVLMYPRSSLYAPNRSCRRQHGCMSCQKLNTLLSEKVTRPKNNKAKLPPFRAAKCACEQTIHSHF